MTDTKHTPMTADEALAALYTVANFFSDDSWEWDDGQPFDTAPLNHAITTFAALIAERDALRKCLKEYRRLHDFLSDAIEGGRLTEADVPDDYHAFVYQLEECARLEYLANQAIDAASAEASSHG